MIATMPLGSFVVNLGRLVNIPRGERRLFRIGAKSIAVVHADDGRVMATSPESTKTYPVSVNEEGSILVGIEQLLPVR